VVLGADHVTIIDFEFAAFGHALIDGAYGRIMFPTCWCCNRIPDAVVAAMENAYRAELTRAVPEAADDRLFNTALVAACAHWALGTLTWHLDGSLKEDREWGISTMRPRILARLDAFIATAESHGKLPALHQTLAILADDLRAQWPDMEDLPLYPAFRPPMV